MLDEPWQHNLDQSASGKPGAVHNKINSISETKNPTAYERTLIKGATLLRNAKYIEF